MCRHRGTCVWYTLMLLFTKKVKKDRGHYFSPLSSIRVIALVRKISYELHRNLNQYIPEGFTCLRILYTLVMDQIPIKCDMNDFSLGLKKRDVVSGVCGKLN